MQPLHEPVFDQTDFPLAMKSATATPPCAIDSGSGREDKAYPYNKAGASNLFEMFRGFSMCVTCRCVAAHGALNVQGIAIAGVAISNDGQVPGGLVNVPAHASQQ